MLWLDYCSYRYLIDLEKQMYPKNALGWQILREIVFLIDL